LLRSEGSVKTYSAKKSDIEREWHLVDATDQTLGRMASQIATVLRGKHKPYFTPHVDCGDFVVVVNAEKIYVSGNRIDEKLYHRHSGYPGGIKVMTLREMMAKKPEQVITMAVRRMLPKNTLGRQMLKKLKVYAGPDHPHEAQNPEPLELGR
jgi:large subunit ribosomal protein L13